MPDGSCSWRRRVTRNRGDHLVQWLPQQAQIGSSAMFFRIPDKFHAAGRSQYRVGRRGFVGSALAAATLPLGRAWADAKDVELPEQLSAIGLDGQPIAITRA